MRAYFQQIIENFPLKTILFCFEHWLIVLLTMRIIPFVSGSSIKLVSIISKSSTIIGPFHNDFSSYLALFSFRYCCCSLLHQTLYYCSMMRWEKKYFYEKWQNHDFDIFIVQATVELFFWFLNLIYEHFVIDDLINF